MYTVLDINNTSAYYRYLHQVYNIIYSLDCCTGRYTWAAAIKNVCLFVCLLLGGVFCGLVGVACAWIAQDVCVCGWGGGGV